MSFASHQPPSKVLKPSAKAKDVKQATSKVAVEGKRMDSSAVELVLGNDANHDLVYNILSFIIHPVSESCEPNNTYADRDKQKKGVIHCAPQYR
jgi:hypothetical protein